MITNGFKEVQHIKLAQCDLQKYFDNVIISEDVGHNKPNIEIFKEAERLGNTTKEACLMIGDNFEADIEGAKSRVANYLVQSAKKQTFSNHTGALLNRNSNAF